MRILGVVAIASQLGCSGAQLDIAPARDPNRLLDCTNSFLAIVRELEAEYPETRRSGYEPAQFPSRQDRVSVLDAATEWSTSHGYLPCREFQMCAALLEGPLEQVLVKIRTEEYHEDWLGPAADLSIARASVSVVSAAPMHTGCAARSP